MEGCWSSTTQLLSESKYPFFNLGTASLMGWAFSLYALAELVYMTYHLDWTVFLFAHTISEVLDLLAFVLLFVAATHGVRLRQLDRQSISVPAR